MINVYRIITFIVFSFKISFGFSQIKEEFVADLPPVLNETSGLVCFQNKYLISHNDGGNSSSIYLLNMDGDLLKEIQISNIKNRDWEDLAKDEFGNLFIGDFGNNNNSRKHLYIYKIEHGFIDSTSVQAETIEFTYEDQTEFPPSKTNLNFDCEAFIIHGDSIILFTKCRTEPFTGVSNVYYVPNKKGKHIAKKIHSIQLCDSDWRFCSITSSDYNSSTNQLVLLTYSRLYIIDNFNFIDLSEISIKNYQLNFVKQREAISIFNQTTFYMTDEYKFGFGGGNLYKLILKK